MGERKKNGKKRVNTGQINRGGGKKMGERTKITSGEQKTTWEKWINRGKREELKEGG